MSDVDAVANLLERLAGFEVELNRVREGKKPAASLDLLTWTAGRSGLPPSTPEQQAT